MKERVTAIVNAYFKRNVVAPGDVPALIASVAKSFAELEQASIPEATTLTPAVPIRRSVRPDTIICLDCGWSGALLKRHLSSTHGLSPTQYRGRWNLSEGYPLVATEYSARRSELAKAIGLGHTHKRRARN